MWSYIFLLVYCGATQPEGITLQKTEQYLSLKKEKNSDTVFNYENKLMF